MAAHLWTLTISINHEGIRTHEGHEDNEGGFVSFVAVAKPTFVVFVL